MTKTLMTVLAVSALCVATFSLTGCGTMTPELMSSGKAPAEIHYTRSRVMDNNTRGIWDDLDRIFMLEKNSGLSPYPMR